MRRHSSGLPLQSEPLESGAPGEPTQFFVEKPAGNSANPIFLGPPNEISGCMSDQKGSDTKRAISGDGRW